MTPTSYNPIPIIKLLRPHQWTKNALLFLPLLMAHRVDELSLLAATAVAAACFSLMASAVYVMNDCLDAEADRQHPEKCSRPIAAGTVSIQSAVILGGVLVAVSLAGALTLFPPEFAWLLCGYLSVNLIYSLYLKKVAYLDAVTLTGMFLLRIYAGGLATGLVVTEWLIAFAFFFFLSIAFAKRAQELMLYAESNRKIRGYRSLDLKWIQRAGLLSGIISVVVLALYIQRGEMIASYSSPGCLWLLCPVLLLWILRLWKVTAGGKMHHDPIAFVLRDPPSYLTLILILTIVEMAYRM